MFRSYALTVSSRSTSLGFSPGGAALSHATRAVRSLKSRLLSSHDAAPPSRRTSIVLTAVAVHGFHGATGDDAMPRDELDNVRDEGRQRRRGHAALSRAVLPEHDGGGAGARDGHGTLERRVPPFAPPLPRPAVPPEERLPQLLLLLRRFNHWSR
jgi:hypothetical protein